MRNSTPMSSRRVLHYGLQRSGTNFLKKTIEYHFDVALINKKLERSHIGHKHFRLYDDKSLIGRPNYINALQFADFKDFENQLPDEVKADAIIILSKDPYSWYLSYIKWGKRHNWPTPSHPDILEYNAFYKKWLQFSEESEKVVHIKYIDLLTDQETVIQSIKKQFGFEWTRGSEKVRKRIKKVPYSSKFTHKRLRYYSDELFLKDFNQQALKEINNHIDHELIEKLGYKSYF